jgi:hypothetical protein
MGRMKRAVLNSWISPFGVRVPSGKTTTEMPSFRRSAARLRLLIAFQGFFRFIGIWPDLLRTKPRRGTEKSSSLMM